VKRLKHELHLSPLSVAGVKNVWRLYGEVATTMNILGLCFYCFMFHLISYSGKKPLAQITVTDVVLSPRSGSPEPSCMSHKTGSKLAQKASIGSVMAWKTIRRTLS
jgi:hypothetical protein